MTPQERIRARLSPAQLERLADLLDEICDEGGSFSVGFRSKRCRNPVVSARFAKDEEVGWPQRTDQSELPLSDAEKA